MIGPRKSTPVPVVSVLGMGTRKSINGKARPCPRPQRWVLRPLSSHRPISTMLIGSRPTPLMPRPKKQHVIPEERTVIRIPMFSREPILLPKHPDSKSEQHQRQPPTNSISHHSHEKVPLACPIGPLHHGLCSADLRTVHRVRAYVCVEPDQPACHIQWRLLDRQ